MPKFSRKIYKSIKFKVTENQIDKVIQTDVVNKVYRGGGGGWNPPPMTNRVNI